MRGDSLRFKEEGVRDIVKDVFLPWYNALRLLIQSSDQLKIDKSIPFIYDDQRLHSSIELNTNIMDTWIVSYTQTLIDYVRKEMNGKYSISISAISREDYIRLVHLKDRLSGLKEMKFGMNHLV